MTSTRAVSTQTRLSAKDRRRQLIYIGLWQMATRPIADFTIDDVATEAGISRSLLFHYFPSKAEYFVEVFREASQIFLNFLTSPVDAPQQWIDYLSTPGSTEVDFGQDLRSLFDRYVTYLERHNDSYNAIIKFQAGGDSQIIAIYEEARSTLARITLQAAGINEISPCLIASTRAWYAYFSDFTSQWITNQFVARDRLLDIALEMFERATSAAMMAGS